jgi:hypothetical protein
MFLLYINELGVDYRGQYQYEFIFGEDTSIREDDWYIIPSAEKGSPPNIIHIDLVGLLKKSSLVLNLVQNSDYFGVIDAVDGVIALGWESFNEEDDDNFKRLSFFFGEAYDSVLKKLLSKNLKLINEEIKYK